MTGPHTGKEIILVGAPTWTPEALAALAQMAVSELRHQQQRTPESGVRTPEPEQLP